MPNPVTLGLLLAAVAIVVTIAVLVFQRAPIRRKPPKGVAAALVALARGDRAATIQILRGVVEQPDPSPDVMVVLGHLLRDAGEVDRALRIHHAVLARPSLDPEKRRVAELEVADDLLALGKPEVVEQRLSSLDEHFVDAELLERRAKALVRMERWQEAIDVSVQRSRVSGITAVERAESADAVAEIGRELHRLGRSDAADRAARRALNIDPSRGAAYAVLGDVALTAGQSDDAQRAYEDGLANAPEAGHLLLGRVLELSLQKGRLDSLVDRLELLRTARPNDSWLWRATADLRLRRGDREEFFALLEDPPVGAADRLDAWAGWIRHLHARADEADLRRLLAAMPDAFGPREWRCPQCGHQDVEARSGCGRCGHVGPLRAIAAATTVRALNAGDPS